MRLTLLGVAVIVLGSALNAGAQAGSTPASGETQPRNASPDQPSPMPSSPPTRGFFTEPRFLSKGLEFGNKYLGAKTADQDDKGSRFFPEMGNMVTGAGWISAGVGYRRWLGERVLVEGSTGLSWRAYKMAQARFEVQPFADERLALGAQVRWQDLTQITYYGDGPESLESNRSEYRLKSTNMVGYATLEPREWLAVHGRVGWLPSPSLGPPAGTFLRGNPPTSEAFPNDPVYAVAAQPDFLHGELAVVADSRDEPGYPRRGGIYRVSAARFADQDADRFTFNRFEVEAAHFVPLVRDNVVLAVRGWLIGTTTPPGHSVPFYLAPSLGGNNSLRGYNDYRFHDRNLALVNSEVRVAVFEHVDVLGLFEAGNVAPTVSRLNLDKTSYGVGVRLHTERATIARFEVAHSTEGWHAVFRMNDPFSLSRLRKRTAPLPFAP